MNFAYCLHIVIVIGKYTSVLGGFLMVGERVTWEKLSMEELIIGKEHFQEGCAEIFSII